MQARDGTHNIGNGIHRADFVKMNLLGRGVVHARLRHCQTLKHLQRLLLDFTGQLRRVDDRRNMMQVAMLVLRRKTHRHAGGGNVPAFDFCRAQLQAGQLQRRGGLLQIVKWNTGVNQRAQNHVAAGAGDAIKVSKRHEGSNPETMMSLPQTARRGGRQGEVRRSNVSGGILQGNGCRPGPRLKWPAKKNDCSPARRAAAFRRSQR